MLAQEITSLCPHAKAMGGDMKAVTSTVFHLILVYLNYYLKTHALMSLLSEKNQIGAQS